MAQKLSNIKLKYIHDVIIELNDKSTILDPARFREKKDTLDLNEKKNGQSMMSK